MNRYDIEKIRNILPKELMQSATYLDSDEIIWNYKDSISLINSIKINQYVILGGDVYQHINGRLEVLGDNWYIDMKQIRLNSNNYEDKLKELSEYSAEISKKYIKKYEDINNGEFYYSIVIAYSSNIVL